VHAIHPGLLWQAQLDPYAPGFTRPGFRDFATWGTGLALNVEEHTITQSLVALDRPHDWKALEAFAEHGAWDEHQLERINARLLEDAPGRTWYGFHVWAGDDTKVHRSSKDVWGTCTFHDYSARCPNRASTVRAHNWVVTGALLPNAFMPAHFLPVAGQLYFRKSQMPDAQKGPPICFRTKCQLLVGLLRDHAGACPGKNLGVFDGAYAKKSVVGPLVKPDEPGQQRIDVLTRLRHDAVLHALPPSERKKGQRGPMPRRGKRLSPPRQGGRWPGQWQDGTAFIYGRSRAVRYKEVLCLWRVTGHGVTVKAVVASVEGYKERFTLVCSASELSGLAIVELFCARFRQEDAFRDLKQRLGWEECRAWTRNPIERTTQALFTTMTAMRLLQMELQDAQGDDWWLHPPWNPTKSRPSILDVERLLCQHRQQIQRCLAEWLDNEGNTTR
jgi:hypothetical protein